MTTIDLEVARLALEPPFLVKLDTHGFELAILAGAAVTLRATDALVIEAYNFELQPGAPTFSGLCRHMADLGFRVVDLVDTMRVLGTTSYGSSTWSSLALTDLSSARIPTNDRRHANQLRLKVSRSGRHEPPWTSMDERSDEIWHRTPVLAGMPRFTGHLPFVAFRQSAAAVSPDHPFDLFKTWHAACCGLSAPMDPRQSKDLGQVADANRGSKADPEVVVQGPVE